MGVLQIEARVLDRVDLHNVADYEAAAAELLEAKDSWWELY